ncbi:MAG: OmpA family protein [Hyphomicrobiales bacterium]
MRARWHVLVAGMAALFFLPRISLADNPSPPYWYLAPTAGIATFDNAMKFPTADLKDKLIYGGRLGRRFSNHLSFEAAGDYSKTQEDIANGADVKYLHLGGDLRLHLTNWRIGSPFVGAGGSYTSRKSDPAPNDLNYGAFDLLGGWESWLGGKIGIRLEARNVLNIPKGRLDYAKYNEVFYLGGLTFALGGKIPDTDGDGVNDKKDQCPNTPTGAIVDPNGCPIDSDGDGVYDGLDQCANTPKGAKVDPKGCPMDSDGDGVYDGIDQCPDTPKGAKVDDKGCPIDSDGDGVPDGLDQCDNTPTGAKVDANGCPIDSDKDGVPDGLDKCPDTPANAKVDKDGCPIEVTEKETELLDTGMIRLENVNFETGKSDITDDSKPVLDTVGQVLSKWPELRIEIGGHTDSRGSAAYNQKLSQERAQAVLSYLLQKFPNLKPDQFVAKGYGESKPVVPNTSPLNMAKNRRVEFVVLNKDVLKREVEKRKLLEK